MKPQDFHKITEYFTTNGLTVGSARFAFSKYIESVDSGVEEFKKKEGREPTEGEIRQICGNYLSRPILQAYLELAKVNQETEEKNIAGKYAREGGLAWWVKSVAVEIIGSFIFVILLVLIFAAGKDQLKTILVQLDVVEQSVGEEVGPPGGRDTVAPTK